MKTRCLIFLSVLFGFSAFPAGLNNGSSWDDAWTNLSSVTWTRGDTYYIAGGTYDALGTLSPSSGTNWLTIKKANATDNGSDVGWQPAFASDVAVINGQMILGGGYLSIDGITGSGTSGHGIKFASTNDTGSVLTLYATASYVTLARCELTGPGAGTSATGNDLFTWNPVSSSQKGLLLSNCWFHGATRNGLTLGRVLGTSHTDYGALIDGCVISETGKCTDPSIHGQGIHPCSCIEDAV